MTCLRGQVLNEEDVYLAIPLQKGQISCREFRKGEVIENLSDCGLKNIDC